MIFPKNMEVEVSKITHKNIEVVFIIVFQYFIQFSVLKLTITVTAFISLKLLYNDRRDFLDFRNLGFDFDVDKDKLFLFNDVWDWNQIAML